MLAAVFMVPSFAEEEPEGGGVPVYSVNWYVNGVLAETTETAEGQQPVFGSVPDRGLTGAEFAGWSAEPDSLDYKAESELPAVTKSVSYYAAFTEKTFFYMVLEGKQNTSASIYDYMYAGTGILLVPDGFGPSDRWYTGGSYTCSGSFDITKYIVKLPDDADVRRGLAAAYGDYNDSWQYIIQWTTLSHSGSAAGYDYGTLSSDPCFHCDGAICIDRGGTAGVMYRIRMADDSILLQSAVHNKNASFPLNSTVSQTGNFSTDGYEYSGLLPYSGIMYHFDGWYTDPQYTYKASDTWTAAGAAVLYARYTDTYTVSFLDYDGTLLSSGSTYHYGSALRIPDAPDRGQDASYSYSFLRWDPAPSGTVTEDAVYTAVYSAVKLPPGTDSTDGTDSSPEDGNNQNPEDTVTAPAVKDNAVPDVIADTAQETVSADEAQDTAADDRTAKPAIVVSMISGRSSGTGSSGSPISSGTSGAELRGTDPADSQESDIRHCRCILHILILLAALVLFILFFVRDRRECREIHRLEKKTERYRQGPGDL